MSDYKSTLGPIDPLDDDLLASGRPGAERQAESSDEETAPVTNETTPLTNETTPVAEDEEAQSAITSRDPAQALLRMGWALVVAVVICTVVLLVGILRVSSAVDNGRASREHRRTSLAATHGAPAPRMWRWLGWGSSSR